jgi:hypothetical protein
MKRAVIIFAWLFVLLLLLFTFSLFSLTDLFEIDQEEFPEHLSQSSTPSEHIEQVSLASSPAQTDQAIELFQGVTYTRDTRQMPRKDHLP